MKFSVKKSVFMSVLTPAMGTVSNKNTITSIEGVLIETLSDGKIQISVDIKNLKWLMISKLLILKRLLSI